MELTLLKEMLQESLKGTGDISREEGKKLQKQLATKLKPLGKQMGVKITVEKTGADHLTIVFNLVDSERSEIDKEIDRDARDNENAEKLKAFIMKHVVKELAKVTGTKAKRKKGRFPPMESWWFGSKGTDIWPPYDVKVGISAVGFNGGIDIYTGVSTKEKDEAQFRKLGKKLGRKV